MKTGIVIKTTGSWHTVRSENDQFHCRLKGNFRNREMRSTNPIAVGDVVNFEIQSGDTGIITTIKERKNYIIRKSTNLSKESQILASNIDQVMLMFTIDYPHTPLEFVDRFLLSAEAYHINCILLINKVDLYSAAQLDWMKEVIRIYEYAGYPVVPISVLSGLNMEMVKDYLHGKLTLISGNSGIGKTTLINTLCPGINLKTNEISSAHQSGKHTTTYPEMIEVAENSFIIDSPGIRGFGLTDLKRNEIGLYFKDIFKLSKHCKFYNCSHIHEPNCAVIEAFNNGVLHESRYRSYFNIYNDADLKYRKG